jgi:flagellar motility protein MotE (MotC chaperone)
MKKNSYDQFFKKAQEVRFKVKPRTERPAASPSADAVEQRLRQAVRKTKRRERTPFPWKAMAGLTITLVLAAAYLVYPEVFEGLMSKVEIGAFGQAEAADAKPAEKSPAPAAKAEKPAAGTSAADKDKGPEEKSSVSEELGHYEKLKQRKEELDAREKELSELEEELQRQKVELDKRLQQLEEMRNQIAQTLKDRVEVDQEKVTKLVDLYSNMKPKQAADVIGSINEDLAVEVLAKMKKKNAAEIMNLLSPEKARVLSEKYTGYRRGTASVQEPKG